MRTVPRTVCHMLTDHHELGLCLLLYVHYYYFSSLDPSSLSYKRKLHFKLCVLYCLLLMESLDSKLYGFEYLPEDDSLLCCKKRLGGSGHLKITLKTHRSCSWLPK